MEKRILVVGSLNMDIIVRVEKMPMLGETVLGERISYSPGGKGANQAFTAGRLQGNTVMLGCVGNDEFGRTQKANLAEAGVDVSRLKEADTPTGTAVIYVDKDGGNSISVIQGANLSCDIPYIERNEDCILGCDYVMLQMEIPLETICYVIRKAKEYGKTVILNPAPAPEALPDDLYGMIDFMTPNETELMTLTGYHDDSLEGLKRGAKKLTGKGVKNVLITMGDRGALLADEEGFRFFAARKVHAVDTTAAGDCFNGAFAVALARGYEIEGAVRFANAAASISVSRTGTQDSIPSAEEVNSLYQKEQLAE